MRLKYKHFFFGIVFASISVKLLAQHWINLSVEELLRMLNARFGWAVGIAVALSTAEASATITNGGFESSFSGWSTIGNVSIQNGDFGSEPTEGGAQALLSTTSFFTPPVGASALEAFFGVALNSISDFVGGGDQAIEGTGIQQTFNVSAGDTLFSILIF